MQLENQFLDTFDHPSGLPTHQSEKGPEFSARSGASRRFLPSYFYKKSFFGRNIAQIQKMDKKLFHELFDWHALPKLRK